MSFRTPTTLLDDQVTFDSLLFPGRRALYVSEVAEKLGVSEQHVSDLIAEGAIQAIDVGGGGKKFWRIPIEAYESFLKKRHNLAVV